MLRSGRRRRRRDPLLSGSGDRSRAGCDCGAAGRAGHVPHRRGLRPAVRPAVSRARKRAAADAALSRHSRTGRAGPRQFARSRGPRHVSCLRAGLRLERRDQCLPIRCGRVGRIVRPVARAPV